MNFLSQLFGGQPGVVTGIPQGMGAAEASRLYSGAQSPNPAGFPPNFWANAPHTPDASGHSLLDHPDQFENGYLSGPEVNVHYDGVNPPTGQVYGLAGPTGFAGPSGFTGGLNPNVAQQPMSPGDKLKRAINGGLNGLQQGKTPAPDLPQMPGPSRGRGRAMVDQLLQSIGQRGNYLGRLGGTF